MGVWAGASQTLDQSPRAKASHGAPFDLAIAGDDLYKIWAYAKFNFDLEVAVSTSRDSSSYRPSL
jgi:hypothetical protein